MKEHLPYIVAVVAALLLRLIDSAGLQSFAPGADDSALLHALQEAVFWVFGSGGIIAKVPLALAAACPILFAWRFRHVLGRTESLALAVLLATDPLAVRAARFESSAVLTNAAVWAIVFCAAATASAAVDVRTRRRYAHALWISVGVYLVSGPLVWDLLVPVTVFLIAHRQVARTRPSFRTAALLVVVSAVLAGSAVFMRWEGLQLVSSSASQWLRGWIVPSGISAGELWKSFAIFGLIPLAAGSAAMAMGWFAERRRFTSLILWLLWAGLATLAPGRDHTQWLALQPPLLLGAAWLLARGVASRRARDHASDPQLASTTAAAVMTEAPRDQQGLSWEPGAWVTLVFVAFCARVYDLGARVMSHDESIHALSAYQLLEEGSYRHDPAYHGPLMYYVNAAVYAVLGDSDATARLAPALIGTALVASFWWFRRYIGRTAALCGAVLVAISPTLLFYSRYIREDIYVALFTVAWIWGCFRYLEERHVRWLYVVALSMALAFLTKESAFLTGGIIGSFFAAYAFVAPGRTVSPHRAAAGDLAVLMLALVLPFSAGLGYFLLGWDPVDRSPGTTRLVHAALLASGLVLLSVAAGVWWFSRQRRTEAPTNIGARDWLKLFVLFWFIEILFFTSFFTNPVGGLITGVAGSTGYWLTQHEVARGSQPWFYYLVVGGLYEFLPLIAGSAAAMLLLRRMRDGAFDPVVPAEHVHESAIGSTATRRLFVAFVLWWAAGSWIAFGWAGERMPWLLAHQVLPLMLLAGWAVARVLPAGSSSARRSMLAVAIGTALGLSLITVLLHRLPIDDRGIATVAATSNWWARLLVLSLVLPWLAVQIRRAGRPRAVQGVAAGILIVLGVLTFRASVQLAYVNYDLASEILSYAQAAPDVKRVLRTIDEISERVAGPRTIPIAFDDESAWPFLWYFREYPNAKTWGTDPTFIQAAPIVLAGGPNLAAARPFLDRGYVSTRFTLYWWPIQDYAGLTLSKLWSTLRTPASREHLWRVFFDRDYAVDLTAWPLRRELYLFIREDVLHADSVTSSDLAPVLTADVTAMPAPERVITGPFADVLLHEPTSVSVAPDGSWVIADGGNDRVIVLDPEGTNHRVIGDGQLNDPWGASVAPTGVIVVADTWNGRIQVFDRDGRFLRAWGRLGVANHGEEGDDDVSLFGPRGLVVDDTGRIVVADTGNKRLLVFDTAGKRRAIIGAASEFPEFFDEPTAVASDSNGTLLVADAWNQRIVRVDGRGHTIGSWRVPGWSSRSAEDKPAVAVDDVGIVYATDPGAGRLFAFSPSGRLEAAYSLPADDRAQRPTGVAVDRGRGKLLIVDHAAGRLLVFPLDQVRPGRRGPSDAATPGRPSATATPPPAAAR